MRDARTRLASVGLGVATQASRLVLLLVLARYLEPAEVGAFALASATVAYVQYFLAADFYAFTTREMPGLPRDMWPRLLRTHMGHAGRTYGVVLPALLLAFPAGILRWRDLPFVYALLVLEHAGQELYRVLTALERPLRANASFFLRSGAWAYAVAALMFALPSTRRLTTVWVAWMVGALVGLALAVRHLQDLVDWRAFLRERVDAAWLRAGTRQGLGFLAGTLALRGLTVFDRYILQLHAGAEEVAVYALYGGVASGLQMFVSYGSTMVLYPRLVAAHAQGRAADFARILRRLLASVAATAFVLAAAIALVLPPVVARMARAVYHERLDLLWVWLAQAVVASLALVPHYALFARRIDRPILVANVAGLAVSLAVGLACVPRLGAFGAALGPLAGVAVTGLVDLAALLGRGRSVGPAPAQG